MIRNSLTQLKMKGSLEALDGLEKIKERDPFVISLLRAESDYREDRATSRRLSGAKFPVGKEWCDIDPSLNPGIKFSEVQALGDGSFMGKQQNLCLMGQQGTGKTHSLIALGRELCRKGKSVRFYTACDLVNTLEEAKEARQNNLSILTKT